MRRFSHIFSDEEFMMQIDILTLFPEYFYSALFRSVLGKAVDKKILNINIINIREFCADKHKSADDYPYGGGPGMIIKPEPLARAIESLFCENDKPLKGNKSKLIVYTSPEGKRFDDSIAKNLAGYQRLIFICGHYEGIDERIRDIYVDEDLSIGDYVLTGGELPVMVIIDALTRFLPGVLGNEESAQNESFSEGLLEHPQYTRPARFRGIEVPKPLLSGNHKDIEVWKKAQSLKKTKTKRPDLLKKKI